MNILLRNGGREIGRGPTRLFPVAQGRKYAIENSALLRWIGTKGCAIVSGVAV